MITGGIFCLLMVGFTYVMEHSDIQPGISGIQLGAYNGITDYESGLFFTAFVFLQFWNLFNAKAYGTNKSAWTLKDCRGFIIIAGIILIGQLDIIYIDGRFFNVVPLELDDLLKVVIGTSSVMIIGEIVRFIRSKIAYGNC